MTEGEKREDNMAMDGVAGIVVPAVLQYSM